MVRDDRHDAAYIFGAICPARDIGAAIIAPAADAECMNHYLAKIATLISLVAKAVLICDGAGWHKLSGGLTLPDDIELIHLPPYAPELNPMEYVWDYLRGDHRNLSNGLELAHQRPRPHPLHRNQRLGNGQCRGRLYEVAF